MKVLQKDLNPISWPADYCLWLQEGRYDREFEQYDKYLKPDHTFVDLGAWVGAHSLYAATIAKAVISVEPDPVAFDILSQNIGPGGHTEGTIVYNAISDKAGTLKLGSGFLGASTTRANPAAGNRIGAWEEGQTCEVQCITLRELIQDLADPLFIKIDIEGSEEDILKDADLFRERKPTVLLELHPWWWKDEKQANKDLAKVKALYRSPVEIFENTWILTDV
jgi:FkbM family methyltransferase